MSADVLGWRRLFGALGPSTNTATYWHALRANHIKDRIHGFGRLLEDF